jgi:uncharacterized protein (DUF952 family)
MLIYHIATQAAWGKALASGVHAPPSLSEAGFLHCCRESQIGFVLGRFFAGQTGLLVLGIDPAAITSEIRWERSEPDQDSFPHLFGPLPVGAVRTVEERVA